jgi:sugar fermentation stimulation protein A
MKNGYLGVDEAGTYALFIELDREVNIQVGALGRCTFPMGVHVYAGSAMRGILSRLTRHIRRKKAIHWHVDGLTTMSGCQVLGAVVFTSPVVSECDIVDYIAGSEGAEVRPPRFGASDHYCRGHLVWLGEGPSIRQVAIALLTNRTTGGRWLTRDDIRRPGDK